MGVQLNIKDAETIRLARLLADASGRSVTETIREALRKEHDAREAALQERIDEVRNLVSGVRAGWKAEFDGVQLSTAHGDLLHDGDGLPA